MQMKQILLATAATALVAAAPSAQADGIYVSVFGGANFAQESTSHGSGIFSSETIKLDPDTGFVLGGAIGTGLENWAKGLRVELEASYRRNDVSGSWVENDIFGGSFGFVDANMSTFAIMANVAYDIDMGWKVKPYVIGGAGWARTHYEGVLAYSGGGTNDSFDVDNSGFAWQLGAGFNYEVSPGVDLGLGYRYFDGPNTSFFADKNLAENHVNNGNHAVMVNLTIDTN